MQKVLAALRAALANEDKAQEIGMDAELDQTIVCVDATCVKANVHFPIDWVLLRDAVGSCTELSETGGFRAKRSTSR